MQTRQVPSGWCENIPSILGESWWPGRLIYRQDVYEVDGVERRALRALCPACGVWVTARSDGSIVAHQLAGSESNAARDRKRDFARDEYGALRTADRFRQVAVAS